MGGKKIVEWNKETQEWLRSRLDVDIETGNVFFKEGGAPVPLFKINPSRKQYLAVSAKVNGKWTKIRLHHLVWFFATGEQSLKMIDHIKGEDAQGNSLQDTPWGNRFENLRQCTDKQNRANISRRGYRIKYNGDGSVAGYFAQMTWKDSVTGKLRWKRTGLFDNHEQPEAIYWAWQRQHHKGFAFCSDISVEAGSNVTVAVHSSDS